MGRADAEMIKDADRIFCHVGHCVRRVDLPGQEVRKSRCSGIIEFMRQPAIAVVEKDDAKTRVKKCVDKTFGPLDELSG